MGKWSQLGAVVSRRKVRTTKIITWLSCLIAFSLLSVGCATGPRYEYVEQKDSARIAGLITPFQSVADYGSCGVVIFLVDGLVADFVASCPGGPNWFVSKQPLYLAPGKHELLLDISEIDAEYGATGRRGVGDVGDFVSENKLTLTIQFAPSRIYRFTANLSADKKTIDVTLWDETSGTTARSAIQKWTVDSNTGYTRNPPPVHVR